MGVPLSLPSFPAIQQASTDGCPGTPPAPDAAQDPLAVLGEDLLTHCLSFIEDEHVARLRGVLQGLREEGWQEEPLPAAGNGQCHFAADFTAILLLSPPAGSAEEPAVLATWRQRGGEAALLADRPQFEAAFAPTATVDRLLLCRSGQVVWRDERGHLVHLESLVLERRMGLPPGALQRDIYATGSHVLRRPGHPPNDCRASHMHGVCSREWWGAVQAEEEGMPAAVAAAQAQLQLLPAE
ncbi:hypothetical protein ABPG75_000894 [Micractinium tetrahymenae]